MCIHAVAHVQCVFCQWAAVATFTSPKLISMQNKFQSKEFMQCVILSVGRYDHVYIITEEPETSDRLISALQHSVTTTQQSKHFVDASLHAQLPFELRALETVLAEAVHLLAVEVRGVVRSAQRRLKSMEDRAVRLCSRRRKGRVFMSVRVLLAAWGTLRICGGPLHCAIRQVSTASSMHMCATEVGRQFHGPGCSGNGV